MTSLELAHRVWNNVTMTYPYSATEIAETYGVSMETARVAGHILIMWMELESS